MGKPRLLLADDHVLMLEGFKKLLEPEFEVVGAVSDGRKLLEIAPLVKPDVILVDLNMPLLNGIEAGDRLRKSVPNAKLVVVTMNEDYEIAAQALRSWASGYLVKRSAVAELVMAIREVLRGKTFVTPVLAKRRMEEFIRDPRPDRMKYMTARQREVLQLLAEGLTMKEAADVLEVTTRTIAFHKYRIMDEFGLKTNSDLMRFAIKEHVFSLV